MNRPRAADSPAPASPSRWYGHPAVHLVLLAAVAAGYLAVSWRRWPDAFVDFGRELYIPWRLAEGAVLYRDVEDFYGPLSQYLNAALFRVFGPGLMVLVWANLAVFAGIVTTTYLLVRLAWGAGAALAGAAVFIAVFGFSRFVYVGNFNYATPYAHETTHGMLVLVLLAAVTVAWRRQPTQVLNAAGGFLLGLTLVLKAEIALSAAAIIATAVGLRRWHGSPWPAREWLLAAALAIVPTLVFAAHFLRHLGFASAWGAACRGWLNVVVTTRYVADPAQYKYSGLDAPWPHLWEHMVVTGGVVALLLAVMGAARQFKRRGATGFGAALAVGFVVLLAVGATLWPDQRWLQVGRCLLGLLLVYLVGQVIRIVRARREVTVWDGASDVRILLAVLAASLMTRMILAGRIYQFGYYQAALAAVVMVAVLLGELPGVIAATRAGRGYVVACVLALLAPGVVVLSARSIGIYREVTLPMGSGRDQFYTFPGSMPLANLAALLERVPRGPTLLVLPEGLMLNYLARMPSPLPHFFFYSAVTENGEEARLVEKLAAAPPEYIVALPRDLTEYGIEKYGVRAGAGGDLFRWMKGGYELKAWIRGDYTGPDPVPGVVAYSGQYAEVYGRKRIPEPGSKSAGR